MTRRRPEKGLMERKLKSQKEAKNVYLEREVLIQTAREKRRGIQGGADPGAEPDINTEAGAGVGVEADKEEETEVRVMTEEEEDLVLKRRKTGKEIGGHSQGVGQGRGGLGAREGTRKEPVKK